MKKLFTIACALILGSAMSFAQTGGSTGGATTGTQTGTKKVSHAANLIARRRRVSSSKSAALSGAGA